MSKSGSKEASDGVQKFLRGGEGEDRGAKAEGGEDGELDFVMLNLQQSTGMKTSTED